MKFKTFLFLIISTMVFGGCTATMLAGRVATSLIANSFDEYSSYSGPKVVPIKSLKEQNRVLNEGKKSLMRELELYEKSNKTVQSKDVLVKNLALEVKKHKTNLSEIQRLNTNISRMNNSNNDLQRELSYARNNLILFEKHNRDLDVLVVKLSEKMKKMEQTRAFVAEILTDLEENRADKQAMEKLDFLIIGRIPTTSGKPKKMDSRTIEKVEIIKVEQVAEIH